MTNDGVSHQKLVESLFQTFQEVTNGHGSHVSVISSPTGYGKTWVIQQFYQRLATSQADPSYWPPSLFSEGENWIQARKSIYPDVFDIPSGASIPWFWWGVNSSLRPDGRPTQALFDDLTQLTAHAGSIFDRVGPSKKLGQGFDLSSAFIEFLGLLGVATIPPVGAAIGVAGGVRSLWQNRDVVEKLSAWKKQRKNSPKFLDSAHYGRDDQINQIADQLLTISTRIPVLLVVDDAHWADRTLVQLCTQILKRREGRIHIIWSTWPDDSFIESLLDNDPSKKGSRRDRSAQFSVSHHTLSKMDRKDIDHLIQSEIRRIKGEKVELNSRQLSTIRELAGETPLNIIAVLNLERSKKLIRSGEFSEGYLDRLPRDLETTLELYWNELSADLRTVLSIASIQGQRFLNQLVIASCHELGIHFSNQLLQMATDPYGVIASTESDLSAFSDKAFLAFAASTAEELWTTNEYKHLLQIIAAFALSLEPSNSTTQVRELARSLHVMLAQKGYVDVEPAGRSAFNLALESAQRYSFEEAIQLAQLAETWNPRTDPREFLSIRHKLANWIEESGDLRAACLLLEDLVHLTTKELGPLDPLTISCQDDIIQPLLGSGQLSKALTHARTASVLREVELGPSHPDTLRANLLLAESLGKIGRHDEALKVINPVLNKCQESFGRTHRNTLEVRGTRAGILAESGRTYEALQELLSLYDDTTTSGELSPYEDLALQGNIARLRIDVGLITDPNIFKDSILTPLQDLVGLRHPSVIATKQLYLDLLLKKTPPKRVKPLYQELLFDSQTILGIDHPLTLSIRHENALLLSELSPPGEKYQAIDEMTQILAIRTREYSAEHPLLILTRANLALLMGDIQNSDEVREELGKLLDDSKRLLGDDHPQTFMIRMNLASFIGENANPLKTNVLTALELFKAISQDAGAIFGPTHPISLRAKGNRAFWNAQCGHAFEALPEMEEVLSISEQVFGRFHPDTLEYRETRDYWTQMVFGVEHPRSLQTRAEYALLVADQGDLRSALVIMEDVLLTSEQEAGPDSGDSRRFRELLLKLQRRASNN